LLSFVKPRVCAGWGDLRNFGCIVLQSGNAGYRRDGEWEFPHRERAAGKVENQAPTAGNGVAAPEPGLMRDFIR
jgi:hypothetical protein